ncbi:MAG: molybdenum cofactor guanylyltransferase [Elusimicrobia bacterium]|nr:molybdenum cofactor guanylyltransferase [Elusimicrobiota bacterium]
MSIIPATGAVLAGGLSSRFGSNKALAPWAEGRLIESATDRLLEIFPAVLVLAKDPDRYSFLKKPRLDVVQDRMARTHPLAGLYSALDYARTDYTFVCGCDMPFLSRRLIERLWEEAPGYEAVVPIWHGRLQPLCSFYSKSCAKLILGMLADGLGPRDLLDHVHTRRLSEEEVLSEDAEGFSFLDLGTRQDYEAARSLYADGRVRP